MAKQEVNENQTMKNRQTIVRSVVTVVVLVALYLLIRRLSGVLLPFLISFVIAYILAPIVNFFQHKCRLKNRVLSVIVTILLVLGVLTGLVAALVPAISKQATSLSNSVKTYVAQWNGNEYFSAETNQRIEELIRSLDIKALLQSDEVQQGLSKVANFLGDGLLAIGNSVLSLAIVFVCIMYIIFLLIDYEKITLNWHKYIPARFSETMQMLLQDLDRNMNAYFRGQALIAAINGLLFAIGFQIIGLPMGIGLGIMIGILNLVPYMQILGAFPAVLLGLIQAAETGRPFWVILLCIAAVFAIVQIVENMVLTPTIMGEVTGMGPAWILLSLSIWGSLLGFVGMIIALPLTTLLISYYKRFVLNLSDDMTRTISTRRKWWWNKKK
ncbi:MAG: AI-2E family transporter [Paludibacteraceae bacterium]|nr:AI-2E family transporter [Paludibacteraceae bacterium]